MVVQLWNSPYRDGLLQTLAEVKERARSPQRESAATDPHPHMWHRRAGASGGPGETGIIRMRQFYRALAQGESDRKQRA